MAQLQIPISDELLAKLKAKALLRRETLRALVNRILTRAAR
jgi:hypothetical protein